MLIDDYYCWVCHTGDPKECTCPKVGDIMSYPCDGFKWVRIMKISVEVAVAFLANVRYNERTIWTNGRYLRDPDNPKDMEWEPLKTDRSFHNKLAVVVQSDDRDTIAVYKHDDNLWLIRRNYDVVCK